MNLSIPIERIPRVGPFYLKKLHGMGIKTIGQLIFHFPHRYEDFSNITDISKVKINETCSILGKILDIKNIKTPKKKMFLTNALIEDKTGAIRALWFNQPYLTKTLKKGDTVCLSGKTISGKSGTYLSSPSYEKISSFEDKELTHTGRLIPVYPETEGLSSRWLRYIIKPLLKNDIPEPLPKEVLNKQKLMPIQKAIHQIHFPDSIDLAEQARKRFSFEELFIIGLFVLRERLKINQQRSPAIPINLPLIQQLNNSLPFKLTDAQKKTVWQILKDIEKPRPMNRLLEGDVGSGKTVVALMAALNVAKARHQVAFMAPTEILAKQHFQETTKLLQDFGLNIGFLTGKTDRYVSKKLKTEPIEISRKNLLEKTIKGEIDILIGTQVLIQDKVKFKNLGLVILDEQHRFGVEQRAHLCQQPELIPHLLSMTATPIPRTLALTIYGDLDLSLIDELPKGRKKIITKLIPPSKRQESYSFIRKEVKKGKQVFVVCPRIEVSEKTKDFLDWSKAKSVKEEYEKLSKEVFPDLKVTMLHGKMGVKEKDKIMKDFKNKKIDILVSTSVIEVGIDIPEATVMVIEGAERFGLSQLHQFRGRVGRSKHQSYCFLFTDIPSQKTRQRLGALIKYQDGFILSEKDLKMRGPGSFIGQRQWGIPDLAMNVLTNPSLVKKTRETAKEILSKDPNLKKYPLLKNKLDQFQEKIHLE